MEAIRITNVRSLRDSGFVKLSPITLLVGRNSSGKSTFLRCLPLLRQSVETATTGPILWYGNYVDFGSFAESLSSFASAKEISLSFRIPVSAKAERVGIRGHSALRRFASYRIAHPRDTHCELSISIRASEASASRNYVSALFVVLLGHHVQLRFSEDRELTGFTVNGEEVSPQIQRQVDVYPGGILPRLRPKQDAFELASDDSTTLSAYVKTTLFRESIVSALRPFFHGNTKDRNLWLASHNIAIGTTDSMRASIVGLDGMRKNVQDQLESSDSLQPAVAKVMHLLLASSVAGILADCDTYLAQFASRVHYAKPVRATAERYYRQQDLAVDEIDADGHNVAMFLRSLSVSDREAFATWLKSELDMEVFAREDTGHVSLFVSDSGEREYNLSDVGFGFSQLLPVVAHLWRLQHRRAAGRADAPSCFAIEQPELHLHPKLQAQMMDVFISAVGAARRLGTDLRLIVETHSEAMVNRIGKHIAAGKLPATEASVVVFDGGGRLEGSEVRIATFDERGALVNWPFGFFEPEI